MMKKMLNILVLLFLVFFLSSCSNNNDAGIIKWNFSNDVLNWNDVKDAVYYELVFYPDNKMFVLWINQIS